MRINFRQGLVSSSVDGAGQPNYLTVNGTGITLSATNRPIVFTAASGTKNYTINFTANILAWPMARLSGVAEAWLYIDVNSASSAKTYGITTIAPSFGPTAPSAPVDNQHWFDTVANVMKVYSLAYTSWQTRIRVMAGHYTTTTLSTVPVGSQVGLTSTGGFSSGTILLDAFGAAVKDSKGDFLTTEDNLLINGSPSYAAKLESNVTSLTASQPIAAFHVVSYTDGGLGVPADYDDVGSKIVGLATVAANTGDALNLVLSGKVYNPLWNWGSANVTLWVDTHGALVAYDPFVVGGRAKARVPVARTIDSKTIIFDQGMGGVGEQGVSGDVAGVRLASATDFGITKLSVTPADFANPIAVGINDPILTAPRAPLDHQHPATAITVSPFGTFSGQNAQQALEYLQTQKITTTGGTVTGNIISTVQATANNHLITLGQVNSLIAAGALVYKRYVVTGASIVSAFNALSVAQRTLTASAVTIIEYSDSVYLWSGGAGAPVVAAAATQFLLLGKLTATAAPSPMNVYAVHGVSVYTPPMEVFTPRVMTYGPALSAYDNLAQYDYSKGYSVAINTGGTPEVQSDYYLNNDLTNQAEFVLTSGGSEFVVALTGQGTVKYWGYGSLVNYDSNSVFNYDIPFNRAATQAISVAALKNCFLVADDFGDTYIYGDNSQIGNWVLPSSVQEFTTAYDIVLQIIDGVVPVRTELSYNRHMDGTISMNYYRAQGDSNTQQWTEIPGNPFASSIPTITNCVKIAGNVTRAAALDADGNLHFFGDSARPDVTTLPNFSAEFATDVADVVFTHTGDIVIVKNNGSWRVFYDADDAWETAASTAFSVPANAVAISVSAGATMVLVLYKVAVIDLYGVRAISSRSDDYGISGVPSDIDISQMYQVFCGFRHGAGIMKDGTIAWWGGYGPF